ncbi:MAG TPA: BREX-2 system phosphatase PglZ [Polaromonas sp.]|uniref:BREX-2 system phosphatase PglZ n=1 Tax=Polaromonas sp. UBA4122 TaxID=1947074 RepID=UPI000EEBEC43|nr:BREX-2 system phosphatase PglZ [Polaromonas sp. UBA4122]HAL37808.1 BREX-2 system phosphatase PglZ [Polaromonas sp.]
MTVSVPQITAQLEAVLAREPSALAIAIKSPTKQVWPDDIPHRGRRFALRWCDSMLAMREALTDAEQADTALAGLVLLTPLNTNEIAEDIAARLARGRVFQPEGWEIVRQLFGAKEVDARLGRYSWMPQVLVDGAAQGAYTPVPNGFLDLETAWKELLQRFLQLDTPRPDATALLRWTMQPTTDASINLLPANARPDALNWLSESAGIAGKMVLACIEAGRTGDAMALGLVCGVLYATAGEGQSALGNAAIRLERFVNDAHVGVVEGRAWAQAAQQLVRDGGSDMYRSALDRADNLLTDLRVGEFAHLSDVLPMGFDQRMRTFAATLTQHVQTPTDASLTAVEEAANRVLTHVLATAQIQRADRVEMARRMARWMVRPVTAASTVADLVCWQADEGSFVDWARFRLLGGDELVEVSHAYEAVRSAAITRRNALGQRFAQSLQRWNAQAPGPEGRIVPLESVLERVVAPLAALQPVLLLVVDGLSTSIFRELFARPERLGWAEMVPAALARPLTGVAAFPTVTEVSRATLLCGRLTTGTSSLEKTGFSTHAELLAQSRADVPPKLFHKGDLSDSTNLSGEVRAAIANPHQRIVGLVYNAVDDHLSGPDQLNQRWTLEDLRLILPILNEAKAARRVVIVTADHGHLLEDGTTQISGGESDRWRNGNDAVNSNEIVLTGGRVRTANGATTVACLWSESVRYSGRKNGYHGGVAMQEVTVPLSVLVPFGMNLPEWQPALPAQPEWWDLPNLATPQTIVTQVAPAARTTVRRPATPAPGQDQLFDASVAPIPTAVPIQADDWIDTLLQSQVYASQRSLAARVAPPDDQMRKLLSALAERGGKLSRAALAQRISVPEIRLTGMLSAARRVLNVDQATVLLVEEAAGTVELNRILLLQQFRISLTGGAR